MCRANRSPPENSTFEEISVRLYKRRVEQCSGFSPPNPRSIACCVLHSLRRFVFSPVCRPARGARVFVPPLCLRPLNPFPLRPRRYAPFQVSRFAGQRPTRDSGNSLRGRGCETLIVQNIPSPFRTLYLRIFVLTEKLSCNVCLAFSCLLPTREKRPCGTFDIRC